MKKLLLIFLFLSSFFPLPVFANEGWVIDEFQSNIEIKQTGEIRVTETIRVDFFDLQKHGIFREIPVVYERDSAKTYTEAIIVQVSRNNSTEKYELIKDENNLRIKIGNPNSTISGKNTYLIIYSVKGVLRGFEEDDQLYWNATSNMWPVPVRKASAEVFLPFSGLTRVICYEGEFDSKSQCRAEKLTDRQARFTATRSFGLYEGLTVVVGYKKGIIPILMIDRPKTFFEKFAEFPSIATLVTVVVFGIGTVLFIWYKHGRDYWLGNIPFVSNGRESIKPIGAKESIVVEYEPPDNLRPAEIGVLMDETANTHDVVATIIDLASRGFLTITEKPKKWMFGSTDYILSKTKKDTKELEIYELHLFNSLFKEGDIVSLSSLKTKFYDELKEVKDHLYSQVVNKKFFPKNPEKVRTTYLVIGILTTSFSAVLIGVISQYDIIYFIDIFIGFIISGILLIICSFFMPRRTAYGRELFRRTKGYREFIEHVEKYRQQFFEKENMFNEVLPYAIVFGLTEKFTKAMKDLGVQNIQPSWYYGTGSFNASTFSASMVSFSNSVSSAIAATPNGSGFSGGGGSGGGFGGGGGGSW